MKFIYMIIKCSIIFEWYIADITTICFFRSSHWKILCIEFGHMYIEFGHMSILCILNLDICILNMDICILNMDICIFFWDLCNAEVEIIAQKWRFQQRTKNRRWKVSLYHREFVFYMDVLNITPIQLLIWWAINFIGRKLLIVCLSLLLIVYNCIIYLYYIGFIADKRFPAKVRRVAK